MLEQTINDNKMKNSVGYYIVCNIFCILFQMILMNKTQ